MMEPHATKTGLSNNFLIASISKCFTGGNIPDLNPIENLWALMKAKGSKKQPSSLEALRKVTKEVWVHKISSDY